MEKTTITNWKGKTCAFCGSEEIKLNDIDLDECGGFYDCMKCNMRYHLVALDITISNRFVKGKHPDDIILIGSEEDKVFTLSRQPLPIVKKQMVKESAKGVSKGLYIPKFVWEPEREYSKKSPLEKIVKPSLYLKQVDELEKFLHKYPKLSKGKIQEELAQIRKLDASNKIEEHILADILMVDESYVKYTRNPKTKKIEVTQLDPANIHFSRKISPPCPKCGQILLEDLSCEGSFYCETDDEHFTFPFKKKPDQKVPKFTPTPLAQRFFDTHDLFGAIRSNLRKHVEQAPDLKNVLRKAYSFPEEIFLKVALNEANWNEALSLKSDERKWTIELEYTDPERQVISKEFITTVEDINSKERVIFIRATTTKKPTIVIGKMIRTREDMKED